MNQSAPFWDFIASLEDQGASNPFFNAYTGGSNRNADNGDAWHERGRFPHRGRHGPYQNPSHREDQPSSPAADERSPASPPDYEESHQPPPNDDAGEGPSGPPPHPHDHPHPRHGPHGHGHGPEFRRGCPGRRGGWWGRHRGPPAFGQFPFGGFGGGFGGGFDPSHIAEFLQSQFGGVSTSRDGPTEGTASSGDFKPLVDVFDTETAFVVHISLPGAKKEDVGVNWDAEKSEIIIGGVIYKPGDEEFLKTLALDERKEVGAFERKVRLGSRANPAQVDVDGIYAKLEDGILRVEVPKLDKDYVEIKKVDVE